MVKIKKIFLKIKSIIKKIIFKVKEKHLEYKAGEGERIQKRYEKSLLRIEKARRREILRGQRLELKELRNQNRNISTRIYNNRSTHLESQSPNRSRFEISGGDNVSFVNPSKKSRNSDPLGMNYGRKKSRNGGIY